MTQMKTTIENLYEQLSQKGLEGRVVPIQRLHDLQQEIESEYARGNLSEEFYRERLQFYQFKPPEYLPPFSSIIVVAMPRPQTPVSFRLDEKSITLTLPPTYAMYDEITRQIGDIVFTSLKSEGFHIWPTRLPLKLLATCSGLAEYGRNNISYIPGMGSFFQLAAFYSDLPCPEAAWLEPRMMERCKTCQACAIKCPTGAIAGDRFLLHADRCLVFHNERSAQHRFPDWINPEVHNCLMGCMLCQKYCPEDKPFLGWYEENVVFSAEETSLLLKGSSRDELPFETLQKLEKLELIDSLELFPRNLGVLIK